MLVSMAHELNSLRRRFGAAIRAARLEKGMTQAELAERADLTLNYIGYLERATQTPSLDTVIRLGRALGMSGSDLLKSAGF